jgi:AAA+ superfamily predicted ATPase
MYATSLQHIVAELQRLDLLLRVQVWRARQGQTAELAAFCVSDAEADELLDKIIGTPVWAGLPLPAELATATQATLDELSRDVARHTAQSLAAGISLRLTELARIFGLTAFDVDVVLLCLAAELDRGYERLYAYLHDDLTRRRLTVDLALNLLCSDLESKVAGQARLTSPAPLLRFQLLELHEERGSLLGSAVRLEPRVVRFLLENDSVDDRLVPYVGTTSPAASLDELTFPEPFRARLAQLAERARATGPVLYFQGPHGAGKRTAAAACCQMLGRPLLVVTGKRLLASGGEFATLAKLIGREARLGGAVLYWADFDTLLADEDDGRLADLFAVLDELPGPAFLSGSAIWEPPSAWRERSFLRITFPPPGPDERLRVWRSALAGDRIALAATGDCACDPELDLAELAGKFRLTGGQIRDAAATARDLAIARAPAAPLLTADDLHAACRLHSNRKLAELAIQVSPHYSWDDIVLPGDQMAQLREIYDQVRHRNLVYDEWGFDGKLAMGKGLSVLFAGPPGTGKTMAADVLARALGLSMYKIDLSAVVSKYIGETEKNLARIFAEAMTSNAILFFDEADALFGKRTQIRDAHDRYANVEVSYLLQKMEEYDGMVILATNLRKNMDEAFVRRLHATVDFPVPDTADRRRIWEQIWPAATPRAADLDLDFLAGHIEVAGGSIRNIALASAFLAAADAAANDADNDADSAGGAVTMAHVLHATRREYQKMGKVLTAAELSYSAGATGRNGSGQ